MLASVIWHWLKYVIIVVIILLIILAIALSLIISNINKNQVKIHNNQPKKYTGIIIGFTILTIVILIMIIIGYGLNNT